MARANYRVDDTTPFSGPVLPLWAQVSNQPIGFDPVSARWRPLPLPDHAASLTAVSPGGGMLAWKSKRGTRSPEGTVIRAKDGYLRIPVPRLGPLPLSTEFLIPLRDDADQSGGDRLEISATGALARFLVDRAAHDGLRVLDIVLPDDRTHSYRWEPRQQSSGGFAFAPNSSTLVLQAYRTLEPGHHLAWLMFLDVDTGRVVAETDPAHDIHLGEESNTRLAPWSPDSQHLITRDYWMKCGIYTPATDTTRVVDLNVGNVTDFDNPAKGLIPHVIGFDDPDTLILASRRSHTGITLTLFDIPTGTRTLLTKLTGEEDPIPQIATMPNGYWQTWLTNQETTPRNTRQTNASPPRATTNTTDTPDTPDDDETDTKPVRYPAAPVWALFIDAEHNPDQPLPTGSTVPDTWAHGLHTDFPPDGPVTVDPRTLMPTIDEHQLMQVPSTLLITHPDSTAVLTAIDAIQARLTLIDQYGDEHPDTPLDAFDIPNYVWATQTHPGQVRLSIDTKGVPYPLMNRTILHLITTTLTNTGLTGAHLTPDT